MRGNVFAIGCINLYKIIAGSYRFPSPVLRRRKSCFLFEHAHKMGVVVAAQLSYGLESVVGVGEKLLCIVKLALLYVVHTCYPEGLAVDLLEIGDAYIKPAAA